MNNKIKKTNIILLLITLFSSGYFFFGYIAYKQSLSVFNENVNQKKHYIDLLYEEATQKMLHKQLQDRIEVFYNTHKNPIINSLKNIDRNKLDKTLQEDYNLLKKHLKSFEILHIIKHDGSSFLRMHKVDKFGDDLLDFRPQIVQSLNEKKESGFYEIGKYGLHYRYVKPIIDNGEFLGLLEFGIRPNLVLKKIETIFNSKGYLFITEEKYKKLKISFDTISKDGYVLCPYCSKQDEFITTTLNNFNLNDKKKNQFIEYKNRYYHLIIKDIKIDSNGNNTVKSLLFDDVTIYKNMLDQFLLQALLVYLSIVSLLVFILNQYFEKILRLLNRASFILNSLNESLIVFNMKNGKIIESNTRARDILGYDEDELALMNIDEIKKSINEESISFSEKIKKLRHNDIIKSRTYSKTKDEKLIPVAVSMSYLHDGKNEFGISVARDITKEFEYEQKIKKQNTELKRLHDLVSESVYYTTSDLDGNITYISKAFETFSGYSKEEVIGRNHRIFKDRYMRRQKTFYEKMWSTILVDKRFTAELKNRKKDGSSYWAKIIIDPIFDENGKKIGYSSFREDVTDKKELEYISSHDQLTKIYNRVEFNKQLEIKMKTAARYGNRFGYIIFDIDHFKSVNDTHGHHIGDMVLTKFADCISSILRVDDFFARWGGEEFVIITVDSDIDGLIELVKKIQTALKKVDFTPVENKTASYGITLYQESDTFESIEQRADKALYKAKENGRDRYEIG